jgi:hypothetical protein
MNRIRGTRWEEREEEQEQREGRQEKKQGNRIRRTMRCLGERNRIRGTR